MKLIDLLVKELPKRGGWPEGVTYIGQEYDRELMFYGRGNISTGLILNELAIDHRKLGKSGEKITRAQYEAALAANKAVVGHNGWIDWQGGECPVDSDAIVEVKFRNPSRNKFNNDRAGDFAWSHDGFGGDIIAYRLRQPAKSEQACDDAAEADDEADLNECIGQDVDTPEWNGEGLPPVGCECELKYKCHNDDAYWERVIILWKRGDDTLVEYVGDHFKNTTQLIHKTSMHVDFRPLRTEAEKVREKLAASLHIAAGASPIELNGIGRLYFKLADAIISGSVFGTTFKAGK